MIEPFFVTDGRRGHVIRQAHPIANGWRFETVAGPLNVDAAQRRCEELNAPHRYDPKAPRAE
jgi:hypothetical protein